MSRYVAAVAALSLVAGCSGNPFDETETGTSSASAGSPIQRLEPTEAEGGKPGDGYAQSISYDAATDTFSVDNLGFDGDNTYSRGTAVSDLGPYAVYEADAQISDPQTGTPITQFTHRAIYGVSTSTNTSFAIVRTGAYISYGFGGFVYQRDNSVILPASGQAAYSGELAGMRDFDGAAGLQYTRANIDIAIDFDDFNDTTGARGDAVSGNITNRRVFDINGNDITAQVVAGINTEDNASLSQIPVATFTVGPGVLDNAGEISGEVSSSFVDNNGNPKTFETGNYYAIVSGPTADEIVGIVVTETTAGLPSGITARETGGFIVYRN